MNAIPYSIKDLAIYFLKLGTIGFGGPVALVGYMHRDLVENRRWISDEDFKEGMALAQLAPGPLAAQLAIYLGYVHYKVLGGTLAGIAFVLPSFVMVIGISVVYVATGGLPWIQAIFYGVGAAVIGLISLGSYKLSKKSLGKDRLLWIIAIVLAAATVVTEKEILWLVLAGGMVRLSANNKSFSFVLTPILLTPIFLQIIFSSNDKLTQLAWFFFKAGAFVFGSGLAIVPFLYGGVVGEYQWLNDRQFLDAVAVAMITPGPVVITVAFIGYLVAGFPGACVAALATFLPCYLFTVLPAPYFRKYGKHPSVKAFVDGVTAAAIGSIMGAVIVLGKRQITELPSFMIALTAALVLIRFKKVPEPFIILGAAFAGLMVRNIGQ